MPAPATKVSRPPPPASASGAADATIDLGQHTTQLGIQPGPETVAAQRLTALGAQCGVTINCGGNHAQR